MSFQKNSLDARSLVALARNVLYVASLGIALYLLLPLLPEIEHSADAMTKASKPLLAVALGAELLSILSYSELLARLVVIAAKMRASLQRRRRAGLGP